MAIHIFSRRKLRRNLTNSLPSMAIPIFGIKRRKKMTVEVRTSEYEFSHGHKPRGRGGWAFYMGRDTGDLSKVHWFNGTYSEAKRQVQAKARELGFESVTVGS
jgi:hypothetical protein